MRGAEISSAHSAVVFDLWGTLVPFPSSLWDNLLVQVASVLGADTQKFAEAWHADYANRAVGDVESSLRRACQQAGMLDDDARIRGALELRQDALARAFRPRSDAVATLRWLRARRYRVGLLTNCTSEVPKLWSHCPLSSLTDATVFSCVERVKKPDLVAYKLIAIRLGVATNDCLFVGDGADCELAGASAAGMQAILLRTEDTSPPETWAGSVIERLTDVRACLSG
jgi:putative hydrolase of the HAD superfamily